MRSWGTYSSQNRSRCSSAPCGPNRSSGEDAAVKRTKVERLHEKGERHRKREAERRLSRLKENRAKAHKELQERCLSLAEDQQDLVRLTKDFLEPLAANRLKRLEERHRARHLPPLLPAAGGAAAAGYANASMVSTLQEVPLFERGVAERKFAELVGSPNGTRRSAAKLRHTALLLDADKDAAAGEEAVSSKIGDAQRAVQIREDGRGGAPPAPASTKGISKPGSTYDVSQSCSHGSKAAHQMSYSCYDVQL